MTFSKCPECGETNYYENSYSVRNFDCGFKGQWDTRNARCGGKVRRTSAAPTISDEVARYRLALLDAAQVTDTIAADMSAADQTAEFIDRLRMLAAQMRAFAGHTTSGSSFDDFSSGSKRQKGSGTGLLAIICRVGAW
jgi:hypothetical protein